MHISRKVKDFLLNYLKKDLPVGLRGDVFVKLYNSDGSLKAERQVCNLVVTSGLNHVAKMLSSSIVVGEAMSYMAIGTGTTAAAAGNADLETPAGNRQALSARTWVLNTVTFTATFAAGNGTGAITEAGIFNDGALATGDMLSRSTFAAVTKGAGDSMQISWVMTATAV